MQRLTIISLFFFFLVISLTTKSFTQDFAWEKSNGPYGGFIGSIAINSNGHIFAGAREGGVFRSIDNGNHWIRVKQDFNIALETMAINKNDHIFIGGFGGIFRSTDNGEQWTQINDYFNIFSIAFSSNGQIFAGTRGGVIQSTDNGDNWSEVDIGLTDSWSEVISLIVNSNDHIFAFVNESFTGTIYRSIDSGKTWKKTASGIADVEINLAAINSSDFLFAGSESAGIFRSTDSGDSWTEINSGLPELHYNSINSFAMSSNGDIFVAIGPSGSEAGGVFRSTDNGDTWSYVSQNLSVHGVYALGINRSDVIYVGTLLKGIFRSTDNGTSWTSSSLGLTNVNITTLAFNSSGHIFAGAYFNSSWKKSDASFEVVFRSTDNGASWTAIPNGLYAYPVLALAINSNDIVFLATEYGLFRSKNNGDNWSEVLPDEMIRCLAINANNVIFAASYQGLYRSTDNGDHWEKLDGLSESNMYSLVINSNGQLFAATSGWDSGGIFRSSDNGESWTPTGYDESGIGHLAINSHDVIFACRNGRGVFRSTDNGETWRQVNDGLTCPYVNTIAINSYDHLFIGTGELDFVGDDHGDGVFCSKNNGDSWELANTNLSEKYILTLACNAQNQLFAGTEGGGVLRGLTETHTKENITETAQSYSLNQNYPNPFNASTTIEFSIPKTSYLTLKVYNTLGEEVSLLTRDHFAAGKHSVIWKTTGLASGIYYYRLYTDQFVKTKKLVLLE